ncbi:DUF4238 domain-containing protein (plasmid) [Priestia aryabhattai]|uniref:DUF4238 domain-containing protein n=1 Tax=Priestia aryabhattai TaxID=412384 RepID=UPI0025A33049|nr:DUF4238 domain-containing protein [Priestia aryabhattai]WJN47599.1 DUF4238 domain-containing protein [Priestia aryabhattai]
MGKVKNQHYVPQSYLEYFANKKGQVWVYDKVRDKKFISNIEGIASQRYFYDVPFDQILDSLSKIESISNENIQELRNTLDELHYSTSEEAKQSMEQNVEKFFSEKVEGNFKKLLDNIRTRYTMTPRPSYSQAFNDEERAHLSVLLGFQIVRSKEFRESYFEMKESMTQVTVDMLASYYDKDYKDGSIVAIPGFESKPLEHANLIYSELPFKIAEAISSHYWFIGVNETQMPFYTSDDPIIKQPHTEDPFGGMASGFASPGIEVAMPISSKLILIIREKSFHGDCKSVDKLYMPITNEQNIIYYNSLQVLQCNSQVYCHENDFRVVEMFKERGDTSSLVREKNQVERVSLPKRNKK